MRKRIELICMDVGAVLLAAALSLLLYNRAEDRNAGNAAQDILPAVIAAIGTPGDNDSEMAVTEIGGYGYIGYLSIPALELPVMSEWDYTRLIWRPELVLQRIRERWNKRQQI